MQEVYSSILNHDSKMPQIVDLFSGCGGFALGFKVAGYNVLGGMDIDSSAAETASYNLHWKYGNDSEHINADIKEVDLDIFNKDLDEDSPTMVIGGPPCQAYSQIGKAKLKSLGEDRVHTKDERGLLFEDFVESVVKIDADYAVMENVLESVNYGGQNIPHIVCERLESYGYSAKWTVLNSANYGVPQIRERVFVIASKHNDINDEILPSPTHKPINDKITPAIKRINKLKESNYFIQPEQPSEELPNWVTVGEALSDLPKLYPNSDEKYQYFRLGLSKKYNSKVYNDYQNLMRTGLGSKTKPQNRVTANSFRKTERDFPIFERMLPGDNYLMASEIAEEILKEYCDYNGIDPIKNEVAYEEAKKRIVPPYSKEKFHEKWKRLDPEMPSHTLVAHLSTDTYSHIHPWEPRGISVREAARIQSFPDDFVFTADCSMSNAYKQIGNAVPPLLSRALAESIKKWIVKNQNMKVNN